MKLSVLANLYAQYPLEETLAKLKALGVEAAEIGAGGYPGKAHCDPEKLLASPADFEKFKDAFKKYDIELCALSCHGNPVHPDETEAKRYHDDFVNTVLLAEKLGLDTVITFSGCPGGAPGDKMPNWATCAWPEEYLAVLDYQWNDVLIPYWEKATKFALEHGVSRIALELHPGFCVYNPEKLMKLREAVGPVIGANFDPSHLVWQGIDPVSAIRYLGDSIYHVHAKDTKVDKLNTERTGVLDTKHYSDEINRSWVFRTVGFGHGEEYWRDLISALRLVGYDRVLSIEHEDSLMSIDEGLSKAVEFLKPMIIHDPKPTTMAWV